MSNVVRSGRAQLRDMSAAQGVYEVDYTLHVITRMIGNIDAGSLGQRIVTANIHSINGRQLKNGLYRLEENGEVLYQVEKIGAGWHTIAESSAKEFDPARPQIFPEAETAARPVFHARLFIPRAEKQV